MPRDERAYLADILESCEAIVCAVRGLDFATYQSSRLIRSSVEREFIIIGEAVAGLARIAPATFAAVTAIVETDVPVLQRECAELMKRAAPPAEES